MNSDALKNLLTSPDFNEFVKYLATSMQMLDSVSDIELDSPEEIAVEVKARKRAVEKLKEVLGPSLTAQIDHHAGSSNKDYLM